LANQNDVIPDKVRNTDDPGRHHGVRRNQL